MRSPVSDLLLVLLKRLLFRPAQERKIDIPEMYFSLQRIKEKVEAYRLQR